MDYGFNLRLARRWAGLTQKELAKKANIATITLQQYERGKRKPSAEIWFAIANALHLSPDELNNANLLPTGPFSQETILLDTELEEAKDMRELKRLLLNSFSELNPSGQQEAVKRVEELTEIPRYQRQGPQDGPDAPDKGEDTLNTQGPLETSPEGK